MRKIVLLAAFVSAMLVALLPGSPAQAQNTRSWVSSTGSGKACTRAAPCGTFQTAHNATNPGGEINCVDAVYSIFPLSISKSITVDCGGTHAGSQIGPIYVDGAGVVVRLRNLSILGQAVPGSDGNAVVFLNGAALYVENCNIFGLKIGYMTGIQFLPQDGVTASLYVTDSFINYNGNGTSSGGSGLLIQPSGSGSAQVVIERSHIEGNAYGIAAKSFAATGVISINIKDSVVANNVQHGIYALSEDSGSTVSVTLDHSSSLLNGDAGIFASGAFTKVILDNSTVMSNVTGLYSDGGATILSYQNNQLTGNFTDGATPTTLSVK